MTADIEQKLQQSTQANLPAIGSLGLFTQGKELVPQSFGESGETVTAAVSRLEPTLKSLIASYIIKKTLNANATNLDVEVSLTLVDEPSKILARTATGRGRNGRGEVQSIYPNKLPLDKLFQFQVTNHSSSNLYFTTLLIDSSGGLLVIFPYKWPASESSMLLAPQQTQAIGNPQELKLKAKDKGTGEVLVIVSRKPLKKAVQTLVALAAEQKTREGFVDLREPVEVMGDLLDDLNRSIAVIETKQVKASETATLSLTFSVG
jgi:hypothetical protein